MTNETQPRSTSLFSRARLSSLRGIRRVSSSPKSLQAQRSFSILKLASKPSQTSFADSSKNPRHDATAHDCVTHEDSVMEPQPPNAQPGSPETRSKRMLRSISMTLLRKPHIPANALGPSQVTESKRMEQRVAALREFGLLPAAFRSQAYKDLSEQEAEENRGLPTLSPPYDTSSALGSTAAARIKREWENKNRRSDLDAPHQVKQARSHPHISSPLIASSRSGASAPTITSPSPQFLATRRSIPILLADGSRLSSIPHTPSPDYPPNRNLLRSSPSLAAMSARPYSPQPIPATQRHPSTRLQAQPLDDPTAVSDSDESSFLGTPSNSNPPSVGGPSRTQHSHKRTQSARQFVQLGWIVPAVTRKVKRGVPLFATKSNQSSAARAQSEETTFSTIVEEDNSPVIPTTRLPGSIMAVHPPRPTSKGDGKSSGSMGRLSGKFTHRKRDKTDNSSPSSLPHDVLEGYPLERTLTRLPMSQTYA